MTTCFYLSPLCNNARYIFGKKHRVALASSHHLFSLTGSVTLAASLLTFLFDGADCIMQAWGMANVMVM